MSQPPHEPKYQASTRRTLDAQRRRGVAILLISLLVVFVVVVVLAFLVATGELTLR